MLGDDSLYAKVLRAYIDSANDAIFVLCDEMKFLMSNQLGARWMGWSEERLTEHLKRRPITWFIRDPTWAAAFKTQFELVLNGGVARFECWINPPDARSRWVEINLSRVEIEDVDMVIGVARDCTEQRNFITELRGTNAELSDFVDVAYHDFREPLRKLHMFADLMTLQLDERERNSDYDDRLRATVASVAKIAEHANSLASDLQRYSDLLSSFMQTERIDLDELAASAQHARRHVLAETDGRIIAKALPRIYGDRRMLSQLFNELLDNALKFAHPKRPPQIEIGAIIHIEVQHTPLQTVPALELWFQDNGIGATPEQLPTIQRPFRRLHDSGEFSGNGIGLAIVAKIARLHGGIITVAAREGDGARFCVHLPLHGGIRNNMQWSLEKKDS